MTFRAGFALFVCLGAGCAHRPATVATAPRRVLLVTIDGVRWQEVFHGADDALLGGRTLTGANIPPARRAFWRPSIEERRNALMPFLWGTIASRGQLFGNVDRGARVTVTNAQRVSYPGYHDLLCGFSSPAVRGNDRVANPDVTVLEWLARAPGFVGRVEAFASWDAFPFILNRPHAGFFIDAGEPDAAPEPFASLRRELPPPWGDSVHDAFVFHPAALAIAARAPRVVYVAFGDTDEWAHASRYDRYLMAIHQADAWIAALWRLVDDGRAPASLIVTTDHGRGESESTWRDHGADFPGSENTWIAALGEGVPTRGDRADVNVTQTQVAATVAALAGGTFATGLAAPPLPLAR